MIENKSVVQQRRHTIIYLLVIGVKHIYLIFLYLPNSFNNLYAY